MIHDLKNRSEVHQDASKLLVAALSQGSSFVATLGWDLESRWDMRLGAIPQSLACLENEIHIPENQAI
jgi:hypothetical protein